MAHACDTAGVARVTTLANITQAVNALLSDCNIARRAKDIANELSAMPHPSKLVSVLEDHATAA